MRIKSVFVAFMLCLGISMYGQERCGDSRVLVSVDFGKGVLFGKSNLSPLGVDYRGEYKSGYSINAKALYLLDKHWGVGLKYNYFGASQDYLLADNAKYADDIEMYYVAPQLEIRCPFKDAFVLACTVGAGYMHYQNKGLGAKEVKYTASSFGTNMDLKLEYKILKKLSLIGGASCLTGNNFKKLKMASEDETVTIEPDSRNRIRLFRMDYVLGVVAHF
ncbi:outer membrane beta-barrel protein [Bacteroides reticulotermitis]|uniref:outer membrane beta-barrel protein n=1 Tax=Bacteroides reticulotermitis TaxID=1133319 RepID=UPI003A83D40A